MNKPTKRRIETETVHMGNHIDPHTGAVVPPIVLSTTFAREADGSFPSGYVYTRSDNPNRHALEETLANLEGGARALAFSSGQAATNPVFQMLKRGDHVVIAN